MEKASLVVDITYELTKIGAKIYAKRYSIASLDHRPMMTYRILLKIVQSYNEITTTL